MTQCPDPNRKAEDVILTSTNVMAVSIHKTKVGAYAEADNKQQAGYTIVSITKVSDLVTWSNPFANTDGVNSTQTNGQVWVVVLHKNS